MRFWISLSLLILTCPTSPFAQKKSVIRCTETKAPAMRGFSLGMTPEDIDKQIPGYAKKYHSKPSPVGSANVQSADYFKEVDLPSSQVGIVEDGIYLNDDSDQFYYYFDDDITIPQGEFKWEREGLHKLFWSIRDGKVYSYSVYYSDFAPDSVTSYSKQVSATFKLPPAWIHTDKNDIGATLKCNGFEIHISIAYRDDAHITVTDSKVEGQIFADANQILAQRKKEKQEELRRAKEKQNVFKP